MATRPRPILGVLGKGFLNAVIAIAESVSIHEKAYLRPSWAQVRELLPWESPKHSYFPGHDGRETACSRTVEDRKTVSADQAANDLSKSSLIPIHSHTTKIFFNTKKLIVLRCALATAQAAGFDLMTIQRYGQIRNRHIFCFT